MRKNGWLKKKVWIIPSSKEKSRKIPENVYSIIGHNGGDKKDASGVGRDYRIISECY